MKYILNMNSVQYTFSEITKKMVINVCDGRELGHVCDLVLNNYGNILAIVVPGKKSFFKSLTSAENLIIPFNRIVKIGSDIILTDMAGRMARACATEQPRQAYSPQGAQTFSMPQAQSYPYEHGAEGAHGPTGAQAFSAQAAQACAAQNVQGSQGYANTNAQVQQSYSTQPAQDVQEYPAPAGAQGYDASYPQATYPQKAYSIAAEPMFSGGESGPHLSANSQSDPAPSSAQTFYHTE